MKPNLFLLFFLSSVLVIAQDGNYNLGARSAGVAGASVTMGDAFSLFNNVGGLGKVQNHTAFASYQNQYGISELQIIGAGAVYHSPIGNAGLGFYKFGDELFSKQKIHLAIANQIQLVSLGLGIDLLQYNIETVGTRQIVAIQFGGIVELTPQLSLGAHIFNLNQAELVKETGEKVPTVMKAGISYHPTKELMLNVEAEKDLDFDEIFKLGIEYQVVEKVFLRTGFSTQPLVSAFGLGFHPQKLLFDYAYSRDSDLGGMHELSFGYTFP